MAIRAQEAYTAPGRQRVPQEGADGRRHRWNAINGAQHRKAKRRINTIETHDIGSVSPARSVFHPTMRRPSVWAVRRPVGERSKKNRPYDPNNGSAIGPPEPTPALIHCDAKIIRKGLHRPTVCRGVVCSRHKLSYPTRRAAAHVALIPLPFPPSAPRGRVFLYPDLTVMPFLFPAF
mgnify:CR=1 FL=1